MQAERGRWDDLHYANFADLIAELEGMFSKENERRLLASIVNFLGDLPDGSKLQFFLTRKGSLGGVTPVQAMTEGRFSKVRDVATAFAER